MSRHVLERPAINLNFRYFEAKKHGIIVIGSWLLAERGFGSQPCMVLLHGSRPIAQGRTIPCIIPLDSAWKWAAHGDVGDPKHTARVTVEWLKDGLLPGNVASATDRFKVLDAVNSYLSHLITMPPAPPELTARTKAVGDMIAMDRETGKIVMATEVKV